MAFDGIALNVVTSELRNTIIGAKVNKVFEPTRKRYYFRALWCWKKFSPAFLFRHKKW